MEPLGYSTNLHPAESVTDLCATLTDFAGTARQRLGWERLGVDLRLGSQAIHECAAPEALAQLRATLDRHHLSAHTLNGFPLGYFQAEVVKQAAYTPDWTDPARLADSIRLIDIGLALSDAPVVTISTVPGSYRPFGAGQNDPARIAAALGQWCAAAARAQRDHNRTVILALEPEPWCFLENTADVLAFWQGALAEAGVAACAEALDNDRAAAIQAVRRHLGICWDTCHFSLAFADQAAAVAQLRDAHIPIAKVQVSAAPEVHHPRTDSEGIAALRALAEPRFLHQTAARSANGSLVKVEDLDQLDALLARLPHAHTVRSHFHVPIFREPQESGLSTTITDSLAGLRACLQQHNPHVAVETYTWSILGPSAGDPLAGTVRELAFLRGAVDGLRC